MKHRATYTKQCIEYTSPRRRKSWVYTVQCLCGWELNSNEGKAYAIQLFKRHKLAQQLCSEKREGLHDS